MGTPNREPQEYSGNIIEYKDPARYIPIIFLLYSWGSLFGVPNNVLLLLVYVGMELCTADLGHAEAEGMRSCGFDNTCYCSSLGLRLGFRVLACQRESNDGRPSTGPSPKTNLKPEQQAQIPIQGNIPKVKHII